MKTIEQKAKKVPSIRFAGFEDEWVENTLGSLMEVTSVKRIHQSDWTDSGVRFLRARDIVAKAKNEIITEPLFISQEKYEEYSLLSGKVHPGDMLVTGVGTIGVPMMIDDDKPLYFKDGNIIWFKNEHIIDDRFLYHAFNSESIQSFIKESAGIGTVGTYTIDCGKKTPISLPLQRNEQQKIGSFFSNIDSLISLEQKKYDKLTQVKKSMLEKMFPKEGATVPEIRFAGFSGDWKEKKLSDEFVDFIVPMRDKPKSFDGKIPWTRIEDIEGKFLNGSLSGQYVSEKTIAQMNLKVIPKNSLIVSSSATFGVVAVVTQDLITNQTFIGLVPNDKESLDFWYIFFYSDKAREYMKSQSAGSTIFYIARESFENMPVMIPSREEQQKIGSYFSHLDSLISLQQRKLEKLKNIKKSLLEKMFV